MKRKLAILFLSLLIIVLVGLSLTLLNSNFELQSQIDIRDSLISDKTKRELKIKKENEDLVKSLNGLFDKSINKNGKFDVIKFINIHNDLKDSIEDLNWQMRFIRENYGIYVSKTYNKNGSKKIIEIKGNDKIDSALIALEVFRDRLTLKDKNKWSIDLESDNYRKRTDDYMDMVSKYNKLVKDIESRENTYKEKIKFYQDILKELNNKGKIKIDSTSDSIKYSY